MFGVGLKARNKGLADIGYGPAFRVSSRGTRFFSGGIDSAFSSPAVPDTSYPPLKEIAKGRKNACVVISDITRPVPNTIILPPLLKTLEEAGIAAEDIVILIATGMHRPNLGDELRSMVGKGIMDNYKIINHYCRKTATTSTPILKFLPV